MAAEPPRVFKPSPLATLPSKQGLKQRMSEKAARSRLNLLLHFHQNKD